MRPSIQLTSTVAEDISSISLLLISPLSLLLSPLGNSLQYALAILIKLQLCNNDLAGMDTNGNALAIGFLTRYPFDVDDVFEAVDGGDGTFATFVRAADYGDFVVFADWD